MITQHVGSGKTAGSGVVLVPAPADGALDETTLAFYPLAELRAAVEAVDAERDVEGEPCAYCGVEAGGVHDAHGHPADPPHPTYRPGIAGSGDE